MCSTVGQGVPPADGGARLDRVRRLVAEHNRISAALAAAVRDAECHGSAEHDGLRSMTSWLRTHTRLSGRAIGQLVGTGRALPLLPAVQAAFVAGAVTADQVDVIAEIVRPEHLDRAAAQHVDRTVIEQSLLLIATTQPHTQLRTAVDTYLARLDPDGREPDPAEGRSLSLARHSDGALTGTFLLDPVGGDKVTTALESIATTSRTAGDDRTRAQRLADALVQLCDLALASGELPVQRTVKPHLIVTIDHLDLADPATGHGAASTGTGAAISAARARWSACDSTVSRIVLGPDSTPIDLGRSHRVVPAALRRALDVRDRGCVFAGCQAPTWWCEAHHLLEWAFDGPTDLDNLGLLCERHHTKVHHGFRVERDDSAPPGRRWRTFRPDGSEILLSRPPTGAARARPQAGSAGPRRSAARTGSGHRVGRPSPIAT